MWLVLLFGAIIVEWVNYKVFWSKNKPTTHYSQNDHTYHQNDYQPDRSYHSTSNNNSYNTSSQDRSSHGKSYDTTLPKGRSYGSNTSNEEGSANKGGRYEKERYDSNGRRIT